MWVEEDCCKVLREYIVIGVAGVLRCRVMSPEKFWMVAYSELAVKHLPLHSAKGLFGRPQRTEGTLSESSGPL